MTSREYWADCRAIEATLEGDSVMLMSLDDPHRGFVGGVVSQVKREMAARMIHEKQQRLATKAEVEAHNLQQNSARIAALTDANTRAGITSYILPAQKVRRNG